MKNIKTIFSYLVVAALIFGFSISCKNEDKTGSESGIPSQYNGYYKSEMVTVSGSYMWLHVQNGEAGQATGETQPTTFQYLPFTGSGNTYSASGDGMEIKLVFNDNSVTMTVTGITEAIILNKQ